MIRTLPSEQLARGNGTDYRVLSAQNDCRKYPNIEVAKKKIRKYKAELQLFERLFKNRR